MDVEVKDCVLHRQGLMNESDSTIMPTRLDMVVFQQQNELRSQGPSLLSSIVVSKMGCLLLPLGP